MKQMPEEPKKKILVTAFKPFGGQPVNASMEVLKFLPEQIAGYTLVKVVLPVRFEEAGREVIRFASLEKPDHIFMMGEAGGREYVTPEKEAHNIRRIRYAGAEERIRTEEIIPGGALKLETGVPVDPIVAELTDLPIRVSEDAGTYVCNDTYYSVLSWLAEVSDNAAEACVKSACFIHVPYCPLQQEYTVSDESGNKVTKIVAVLESARTAETVRRFIEHAVK